MWALLDQQVAHWFTTNKKAVSEVLEYGSGKPAFKPRPFSEYLQVVDSEMESDEAYRYIRLGVSQLWTLPERWPKERGDGGLSVCLTLLWWMNKADKWCGWRFYFPNCTYTSPTPFLFLLSQSSTQSSDWVCQLLLCNDQSSESHYWISH